MSKYLLDPIKSFNEIRDNYITYIKTAFGSRFEGEGSFEEERERLLLEDQVLSRTPWVEPLPAYPLKRRGNQDLTIEDLNSEELPNMNEKAQTLFKRFIKTGLMSYPMYNHQYEMLRHGLEYKDCVITSGTGSGKTESFLLPLFADIFREAVADNWLTPKSYSYNPWWQRNDFTGKQESQFLDSLVEQQNGEWRLSTNALQRNSRSDRAAAMRAIIIYPMNALVEDQMARLRQALDCDAVQNFMEENMGGNRIFFGRYNSSTPVPGQFSADKENNRKILKKLRAYLRDIEAQTDSIQGWINEDGISEKERERRKELQYTFQRLCGDGSRVSSEMRSRFDMQQTPPDILITNYSMLAIMLMRTAESPMIEKTRQWLAEDEGKENPTHIFHIVIDELHLNRGTSGTEIAYLIRLLINRLGLKPDDKRLRILASSASLEADDDKSLAYLKDFFNRDFNATNIVPGPRIEVNQKYGSKLPATPFIRLKELYYSNESCFDTLKQELESGEPLSEDAQSTLSSLSTVARELSEYVGKRPSGENPIIQLLEVAISEELALTQRLYDVFDCGKYGSRAIPFEKQNEDDNNILNKYFIDLFEPHLHNADAAEGLIILRGLFDIFGKLLENAKAMVIPRMRFHFFFKNIGGLWATLKRADWTSKRPVGKLHAAPKIIDEANENHRVLEFLYCESCGSLFYGGRRHQDGVKEYILPTSSSIESLPEQSSQVMVDKRTYNEYAIFWPIDESNEEFKSLQISSKINDPSRINNNHRQGFSEQPGYVDCCWEKRWLDVYSGMLLSEEASSKVDLSSENYIEGYYYHADLDDAHASKAPALPSHCPFCGVDHHRAKHHLSPLRGFRAGFAKTTQAFARELFYQLPTLNTPKLVTFSDSREDAASVANGIEREQFSDLQRDIFVNICKEHPLTSQNLISSLKEEIDSLSQGLSQLSTLAQTNPSLIPVVETQKSMIKEKEQALQENIIKSEYLILSEILSKNTLFSSPLYMTLKELGVNPAGCNWENQTITHGANTCNWYEINDGSDHEIVETLRESSYNVMQENLASLLFGRLFYNIESSGIGYVTVIPGPDIDSILSQYNLTAIGANTFTQIISSTMRLLGDKFRFVPSQFNPDGYTSYAQSRSGLIKPYIKACANKLHVEEADLGDAVFNYLRNHNHSNLLIHISNLHIKLSNAGSQAYICPKCHRVHLHLSAGICTQCHGLLSESNAVPISQIQNNNYVLLNQKLGRKPIRIHCEELTGQTDNQAERQREFKDFIIPEEGEDKEIVKKVKAIDILNVTTTMEVGVDIGSLQAVMLANMPPQRYNYQQRVGRGGRRGQSYSMILTLCRGRSHDEHYFHNPHQITGDKPPTPFLSMNSLDIYQRLFNKEVLYWAFKSIVETQGVLEGSTHGEFGSKADWADNAESIKRWLCDGAHLSKIREIAAILTESPDDLVDWATDEHKLYNAISEAVNSQQITTPDLAECLAEAGLLPMYGMPTRVKELYTGLSAKTDTLSSVSRDIEMAITSFAPGAQTTKDKKVVTAIGFSGDALTIIPGRNSLKSLSGDNVFSLRARMITCEGVGCTYFKTLMEGEDLPTQCPQCGSPLRVENICTTKAFVTDLTPGENRQTDRGVFVVRKGVVAEEQGNDDGQKTVDNLVIKLAKKDWTWRIGSISYKGGLCLPSYSFNQRTIRAASPQWILTEVPSGDGFVPRNGGILRANYKTYFNTNANYPGTEETIKLAAKKITNVVKLFPKERIEGIQLNPLIYDEDAHALHFIGQGVRSAYYSLGFILQRAIASKLDIDPVEVDVVELIKKTSETGQITLADEPVNGSGFVVDFFKNFESYKNRILNLDPDNRDEYFARMLSKEHVEKCDSTCYECLSNYRNMPYHGLLDWRLGIALFRLLTDNTYVAGLDGNFESYSELRGWPEMAFKLLSDLNQSMWGGNNVVDTINGIPYMRVNDKYVFAVHPLWRTKTPGSQPTYDDAENYLLADACINGLGIELDDIITIDTFNLTRRLGTCYSYIDKQMNGDVWS